MNRRDCSTSAELNLRPISRFTANTVFFGLVRAWRLAIWPTSRSPLAVKPTIEGVVRAPSWLGMTWGAPPSITATQELVVPRSMPMTLPTSRPRRLRSSVSPRRFKRTAPLVYLLAGRGAPSRSSAALATFTSAGRSSRSREHVALAEDLDHRALVEAGRRLVRQRLVARGVERLSQRILDGRRRSPRAAPSAPADSTCSESLARRQLCAATFRCADASIRCRRERALQVVDGRAPGPAAPRPSPSSCRPGRGRARSRLLVVLEVGAPAQELVLAARPPRAAAPRPRPRADGGTGLRARWERRLPRAVLLVVSVALTGASPAGSAQPPARRGRRRETTRAYSMRVEPSTPRPQPFSPSTAVAGGHERQVAQLGVGHLVADEHAQAVREAGVQDPHQPALLLERLEQGAHAREVLELRPVEHVRRAVQVHGGARPRSRRRRGCRRRRPSAAASRRAPSPRASARPAARGSPSSESPPKFAFR